MSKFFAAGNISSDSDDDENMMNQKAEKQRKHNQYQYDDQNYYHEEKRVIVGERQKKNRVFKELGSKAITAINNRDFDNVWDLIQKLRKEIAKAEKIIEKDGIPPIFLKVLKLANEEVQSVTEKKKLKNGKSFNILKQKLRNQILPEYAEDIKNLKEEDVEKSQQEESEKTESSSEDDDEEIYQRYLRSEDPMERRKYWLKREKKPTEKKEESDGEKEKEKKPKKAGEKQKFHIKQVQKKSQLKIADLKEAESRLRKILSEFARLNSQEKREEYLQNLDVIVRESFQYKDYEKLSILLVDIPIRIQVTKQMNLTHFPRENWKKIFQNLKSIQHLLAQSEEEDLISNIIHFDDATDRKDATGVPESFIYKLMKSFIITLERELQKAFAFVDNGEYEYGQRLQDLLYFVEFMFTISGEMGTKEDLEVESAQIAFKVIENMYFMNRNFLTKVNQGNKFSFAGIEQLEQYANPILKLLDPEIVTKAILYLIFNYAINKNDRGKDLLIISHVLENINTADYYTQACFNRCLAQLGISAFCQGNLHETQQFLSELCGYSKIRDQSKEIMKELLAQHQMSDKQTPKNRPLPYYLHLNLNLLEAIELIASMLIEIPYTLTEGGRITSKTFKRLFNEYQKSHFIAEPLNYKDLIYAASNALKLGNWKECHEHLMETGIWKELDEPQTVKDNLLLNIKESALHCYLIGNQKCFKCVSIEGLSQKFELPLALVNRFIYKWIQHRELNATITDDGYLNMTHKRQQKESSLQVSCEKLFSKLQEMAKANEEMLSQHVGNTTEEEEQVEKEAKLNKKINPAMNEKLKAILLKRG